MNTFAQSLYTEKTICMALSCACVALFGLYIYFVSASVVHVVIRTEIKDDIAHIASDISGLESEYIKAQHKISSDIASLQGYKKTAQKLFIERGGDSLVFQTNIGQ